MAIRTLRRRVIIRDYDFNKIKTEALDLYDRATFLPLNYDGLEKIKLQEILRGKSGPFVELDLDTDFSRPRKLLYNLKDYLYNEKYVTWMVTEDLDGYICVQARKNTPKTRLGWAVFEKDLEKQTVNLEDEIANEISKEIAQTIDFELLADILVACGWTKVELPSLFNRKRSVDIMEWCEERTTAKWKNLGRTFVFENAGDAVNFTLVWA